MQNIDIVFANRSNFGSMCIRGYSKIRRWDFGLEVFSHAGLLDSKKSSVIHATPFRGVVEDSYHEFIRGADYRIIKVPCKYPCEAISFARSQKGKDYDWEALIGIALRHDMEDDSKWFCFELVACALLAADSLTLPSEIPSGVLTYPLLIKALGYECKK